MAWLVWVGLRDVLRCDWNPGGPGEFLAITHGLSGSFRRVVWFKFAA
jgi:hypothetical protein